MTASFIADNVKIILSGFDPFRQQRNPKLAAKQSIIHLPNQPDRFGELQEIVPSRLRQANYRT